MTSQGIPRPSPTAIPSRLFVVDRREGDTLVMIDDEGRTIDVPSARLPKPCRAEGAVVRVAADGEGGLLWETARRDRAEERRRIAELAGRARRLRRSDPGGDIVL